MIDLLDRLGKLDSCALSDALDSFGLPGAVTGVGRLWTVAGPVVGRVRTVTAGPRADGAPADHIAAGAVDASGAGEVTVVANQGRLDVSCWAESSPEPPSDAGSPG